MFHRDTTNISLGCTPLQVTVSQKTRLLSTEISSGHASFHSVIRLLFSMTDVKSQWLPLKYHTQTLDFECTSDCDCLRLSAIVVANHATFTCCTATRRQPRTLLAASVAITRLLKHCFCRNTPASSTTVQQPQTSWQIESHPPESRHPVSDHTQNTKALCGATKCRRKSMESSSAWIPARKT